MRDLFDSDAISIYPFNLIEKWPIYTFMSMLFY